MAEVRPSRMALGLRIYRSREERSTGRELGSRSSIQAKAVARWGTSSDGRHGRRSVRLAACFSGTLGMVHSKPRTLVHGRSEQRSCGRSAASARRRTHARWTRNREIPHGDLRPVSTTSTAVRSGEHPYSQAVRLPVQLPTIWPNSASLP